MVDFQERLAAAISASDYSGRVFELSTEAGLGKKTLYNILHNKDLAASGKGPGIFGMARVAELLGVSLDYLVNGQHLPAVSLGTPEARVLHHASIALSAQSISVERNLSVDALLRRFAKSGGVAGGFLEWADYCDTYAAANPTDDTLTVLDVGEKSLSAITMGRPDPELLQTALSEVPDNDLKRSWVRDYSSTSNGTPHVSIQTLNVQMPNHPVRVKMDFFRVLLPVTGGKFGPSILNFSLLIV
jgi:hypothetical protein